MPNGRCFFCGFEALALGGVNVQKFRALHIFDILQYFGQSVHIVSVDRTEVSDVHALEYILLLGKH